MKISINICTIKFPLKHFCPIFYLDILLLPSCDGPRIINTSLELTGHPNNHFRQWIVKAPHGSTIKLEIFKFHLEGCCDFIYVEDLVGPFDRSSWKKFTGKIAGASTSDDDNTYESQINSMVIVLTTDHSNPHESQFGFELHLTVEGNDQNCETTGRFKLYLLYCFNRNNFSKVMRSLPDHDLQSFNVIRSAPKLPSTCQCHQQHLNSMRLLC